MNEDLKREIMENSRHQFIYGENGVERADFLKGLERDYPVKMNEDSQVAIYIRPEFVPVIPDKKDKLKGTI